LLSLQQDDNILQPENLVVMLDNPTSMYMPKDNKYGEANTRERYHKLLHELNMSTKQLLVLIIVYLDGTAIDSKGHIEVCLPHLYSWRRCVGKVRHGAFLALSWT
jgi:hypothetical protein